MNYPLISDYVSSILSAEDNFKELTNLRPVLDNEGQPIMSSGNFAVVFKMKDEQTEKLYAVKCFLKEQEGRAESYKLIEEELEFVSSNYLTPIRYMEDELFVDSKNTKDTEFPVLLMDWVEGITLDKYIRTHIGYAYGLAMLTYRFSKLASWLLAQPFAHGDLKSDNILIKEDGSLVLVDYDGMYVPAMKGQKAREIGSPDFRHPKRTENDFDEHIDDFPIASILLSLKAIYLNPDLLRIYGNSDRLLFSQKDYLDLSISYVIDAIRPLMIDNELNLLYSIFLIVHSQQKLSTVSSRMLDLKRPTEGEVHLTLINNKLDLSDSEVQLEIGRRFVYGFGIPQNTIEAFKWFSLSAEQGNANAQYNLGLCYDIGEGIEQNLSEAIKWYKKAAEQGNANAQYNLGCCYEDGQGVIQNYSEAVKWYKKAAEQGDIDAQYNLGCCYENGKGVEQNLSEAIKWYLKSAEQGNAIAQSNLGNCCYKGKGIKQNYGEAVKWYRKAAEQKSAEAYYYLGECYRKGLGVAENWGKALCFYEKAYLIGTFNPVEVEHQIATILRYSKDDLGEGIINIEGAYYTDDLKTLIQAPLTIKQFKILDGCENIGALAFGGRGEIGDVIIPQTLKKTGINPFYNTYPNRIICNSILYEVESKALYTKHKTELIACWANKEVKYMIADGTEIIACHAFSHNKIEKLYIPPSVIKIEKGAFTESFNIGEVFIPSSKVKELKAMLPVYLQERVKVIK